LDLKIAKLKGILENPGCPYPGQPTFSGTGIYKENTYIGGVGQKVKPLLDAELFTSNGNGLGWYNVRIARGWNSGQFLLLGAGSVSASFHFVKYSLRDPRLLSLLVRRETRTSSSGVRKKLGRAAPLPM
jgi:hypothetical protein